MTSFSWVPNLPKVYMNQDINSETIANLYRSVFHHAVTQYSLPRSSQPF